MTSSFDSIYKKMAASGDGGGAQLSGSDQPFDPTKHVSPVIAHELNNILAIVQGYADRLLLSHTDDMALHAQLKMITEAARRAAAIIRDATPNALTQPIRPFPQSNPEPSVA
jgi:light-regulated signal transduction histidine kinase (bacteriophytochrome)